MLLAVGKKGKDPHLPDLAKIWWGVLLEGILEGTRGDGWYPGGQVR